MKNKHIALTELNKNQIVNIREMLAANKPNFDKNPAFWADFQKGWEEIIEELKQGKQIGVEI
jgi:hypothetical protein